jgi:hypothetical protein
MSDELLPEKDDVSAYIRKQIHDLVSDEEFWKIAQESRRLLLQRSDQAQLLDQEDHPLSRGRLLHEPDPSGRRFLCSDLEDDPPLVTSKACKLRVTTDGAEQVFPIKSLEAILCKQCLPCYLLNLQGANKTME